MYFSESYGQNIDSLIISVNNEHEDTSKIKTYIKITKFYNNTEPLKALPYGIIALKLAEKVNIDKYTIATNNQLGITYYFLANPNRAIELFLKALKICEKNNDSLGISKALNNIGLAYYEGEAYEKAFDYYLKSLEIKLKFKDTTTLWTSYMNIGLSYSSLKKYDQALKNYYQGLEAWKKLKEPKNESYAGILSELAIIYYKTDSLDKAEEFLNEAHYYFNKSKNTYRNANILLNLAKTYRKKGNDYKAELLLLETIIHVNESGAYALLSDSYLELSAIEESKGNIKKALALYKKYEAIKDSLNEKNSLKEMNQIQEIYLIEKNEAEKLVLKKENELNIEKLKKNKIVTNGIITLLIILLGGLIYLILDIRRWKIANSKLKEQQKIIETKNQELHQLNEDKDRFISILAHDLKSPFNSLLGFLSLLLKNVHKYNSEKIEYQLNIINNSAQNTYYLLDDLLNWIRTQSGKLPFEPQELNLFDITKFVTTSMKINADLKKITLNNWVIKDTKIIADRNMLNTIMRNLVANAIKFTGEYGQININAEYDKDNTLISVSDNGIGMNLDTQAKIWDHSQVFTSEGTSKEKGTGFGLLLCKEFVERHGGKIWVDSELGKGSVFKFTLPFYKLS